MRYTVSRLSAFSNVTWDLGDDMEGYRDENGRTPDRNAHRDGGTRIAIWPPATRCNTSTRTADRDWFGFTSVSGLVAQAARADARIARDPEEDRPDHSADERRIRLRRPLSARGPGAGIGLGGHVAPDRVGHRHGRRLRNRRRDVPARHQHLARHRRRLDQRARRRHHDDVSRDTGTWWNSSPASNGGRPSRTTSW